MGARRCHPKPCDTSGCQCQGRRCRGGCCPTTPLLSQWSSCATSSGFVYSEFLNPESGFATRSRGRRCIEGHAGRNETVRAGTECFLGGESIRKTREDQ